MKAETAKRDSIVQQYEELKCSRQTVAGIIDAPGGEESTKGNGAGHLNYPGKSPPSRLPLKDGEVHPIRQKPGTSSLIGLITDR